MVCLWEKVDVMSDENDRLPLVDQSPEYRLLKDVSAHLSIERRQRIILQETEEEEEEEEEEWHKILYSSPSGEGRWAENKGRCQLIYCHL